MSDFLDWKILDQTQVQLLEAENDINNLRSKLEDFLKISYDCQKKRDIAVDFHLYNYVFCKEQAFDHRRTSTFISIMAEVLKCDSAAYSPAHNRAVSFLGFQKLILKHSIQRSPKSIEIFSEEDVHAIVKYATESYYRRYNLYKFVFSSKLRVVIRQSLPHAVEQPSRPILPLNSAFQVCDSTSIAGSVGTTSPISLT